MDPATARKCRAGHRPGAITCQNSLIQHLKATVIMDVEHINAIGNSLADVTKRTLALRGYL
jgi:hypothetical protein